MCYRIQNLQRRAPTNWLLSTLGTYPQHNSDPKDDFIIATTHYEALNQTNYETGHYYMQLPTTAEKLVKTIITTELVLTQKP